MILGFIVLTALPTALVLTATSCENEAEIRYLPNVVPSGIPIKTADQLAKIGRDPDYPADGEYYLTQDIDLSALTEDTLWRPIGSTCRKCGGPLLSAAKADSYILPLRCENEECSLFGESQPPFSGILHGEGKTVSGLVLSGGTDEDGYKGAAYLGLFGYIYTASIHDLTLKVANTAATRAAYTGTDNTNPAIGALAGYAANSTIENITLAADEAETGLYASSVAIGASTNNYIGGLVGLGTDTAVRNITSSLPVDVDGGGLELYVGGIAGHMGTAGTVDSARVTGDINIAGTARNAYVAGITPIAVRITKSTVTIDTLSLNEESTGSSSGNLSGIGNAAVTDCTVDIAHIRAVSTQNSNAYPFIVGGIAAGSSNSIERCTVRFEDMTVEAANGTVANSYIGGIVSSTTAPAKVSDCTVEGGTITVNFPASTNTSVLYVGGLAGSGDIENSSVSALEIDITIGGIGRIFAGGLTGQGVAQHSFIGTAAEHAALKVTRTDTSLQDQYFLLGGISGQADPTATTGPFQHNYAFCDVTLITTGASTNYSGQSAAGLVAVMMGTNAADAVFTQNYAAGIVTYTNNYAGPENTPVIMAGGIGADAYKVTVSKCAALGSVVINGTNTAASKTWRRIAYKDDNSNVYSDNITTIADDAGPPDYTVDSGLDKQDGLYVASFDEGTFFGTEENQLGWDTDVWKWDAAIGYPVFK
jgi:hypothetical protein